MERYYLLKGDKSTVGGVVLEGIDGMLCDDVEFTFLGAKIACPACNSVGTIVGKGPRWPDDWTGKQVALDGDICACKCSPPPEMRASQTSMCEAYTAGEIAKLAPADDVRSVAKTAMVSPSTIAQGAASEAGSDSGFGGASPFAYVPVASGGATDDLAARGVSESDEAECYAQYELDMDECRAYKAAMGGQRFMDLCSQRAFERYQQCRGY